MKQKGGGPNGIVFLLVIVDLWNLDKVAMGNGLMTIQQLTFNPDKGLRLRQYMCHESIFHGLTTLLQIVITVVVLAILSSRCQCGISKIHISRPHNETIKLAL